MTERKAIERLQRIRQFYLDTIKDDAAVEAVDMAISALKKQEEQEAKCCETCRHRNRRGWEEPCNECYMAYEDYYEPYTEEES